MKKGKEQGKKNINMSNRKKDLDVCIEGIRKC